MDKHTLITNQLVNDIKDLIKKTQDLENLSNHKTANITMSALIFLTGTLLQSTKHPLLYFQKLQETLATWVIEDSD